MSAILTDEVVEIAAKKLFFEQCSIMHDHEFNWKAAPRKALFRECARAALLAALPHIGEACARIAEELPDDLLYMYLRGPNDPPGSHRMPLNKHHVAHAIRAATKERADGEDDEARHRFMVAGRQRG